MSKVSKEMSFFERYLSVWVALCIVIGISIGKFIPLIPDTLKNYEVYNISLPIAILIWLMIYPMMLKVDFKSIVNATKRPKGLVLTCTSNWLIKPFSMYVIAAFFFKFVFKTWLPVELADEYLAGAILLGAAPCTAMVFVWSHLTRGDSAYTLVQVAVNDLILLLLFTPIVAFLLGISNVVVPYNTLFLSVLLFVIIPLGFGALSRHLIIKNRGLNYFQNVFLKKFDGITIVGLLLTLTIIFSFQGETILKNPLHIALIAVPLIIQTIFIFVITYGGAKALKLPHNVAAPGAMIGASNFFELAVAVAIALFGLESGATLATVVGVLVEVPLMLFLVGIANNTRHWFKEA